MGALSTVFIDVGGTLIPEAGPSDLEDFERARLEHSAANLARFVGHVRAAEVATMLLVRCRPEPGARSYSILGAVKEILAELCLEQLSPEDIRQAMVTPDAIPVRPFDDAASFLRRLRDLELGRVILSNTVWWTASDYARSFHTWGLGGLLDEIVTSAGTIVRKPDRRIFQIALAAAGDPLPSTCVMIGNSEEADIAPARALRMLTILVAPPGTASDADAVVQTLTQAADTVAAWNEQPPLRVTEETAHGGIRIALANGSDEERHVRGILARELETYDASRFAFTDRVVIDQDAPTAYSHPVLTLRTLFSPRTPLGVLATYIHEQLHWFCALRDGEVTAAMDALRGLYPDPPDGAAAGARSAESVYLHLVVNHLELQALTALVGEERARETLGDKAYYRWMYERVLEDGARIAAVLERTGLTLP